MADTGWVDAGTAETIDYVEEPDILWENPDNAKTSDNSRATCSLWKVDYSEYLRMTNFSFGIAAGSTILGIEVKIERLATESNKCADNVLKLVKDGVVAGDNKASATKWTTSDVIVYYGGAADLWNSGYGYTDVTDSGFGVQLAVYYPGCGEGQYAAVDHIAIRITYTPPAPPGYGNDVNDVPATNIGRVNDVLTANINTINEV